VVNLAHSASFHSREKTAPSKSGIKHLAVVWPQFIALAVIGSVLFGYALARFRSTLGTMT
jgi:hypothetical protein